MCSIISYCRADVPPEKMNLYNRIMNPVSDVRVNSTKWVVLR